MANITKRGDSYRIRVLSGYDENQKQKTESITWKPDSSMGKREIERTLKKVVAEFEDKVRGGLYKKDSSMKLSDFSKEYLNIKNSEFSPPTLEKYRNAIDTLITPTLGHLRINEVSPLHVQKFVNQLSELTDLNGKIKYTASSVHRYFGILQSIFSSAVRLQLIQVSPATKEVVTLPAIQQADISVFNKEEAIEMLTCLEDEPAKYQALIQLAVLTGCRRGELVALKWTDIDLQNRIVTVRSSAYKMSGEAAQLKSTKTNKIRRVTIPQYSTAILTDWKFEQNIQQRKLGDRWRGGGWVFTQWDGEMMNPHTPSHWFADFLDRHALPHRKFHALRHTSATLLLSSGTDIKTVAGRLGHSQLSTTNRYVHYLNDVDQSAADALGESLRPKKKEDEIDQKKKLPKC